MLSSEIKERNGVSFVTFPAFDAFPELVAANSTRLGGVSAEPFSSMNLGFNRGDREEAVLENYRRFTGALEIPCDRLVLPKQTHSLNVRRAGNQDAGTGILFPVPYSDVDALITAERNLPLVAYGSDCVPVFFYDRGKEAIGIAHAGWRGTVGGIVRNVVKEMKEEFGTDPGELLCVIGPSICGKCFEIGGDVAELFRNAFPEGEKNGILKRKNAEKWTADLWLANKEQLLNAGVSESGIVISGECTMCRPELYWSHRATNGVRGSNASMIMLREKES